VIKITYSEALRSPIKEVLYKLEFCDSNFITIQAVEAKEIDGSISIQKKNGIRRTCNITLDNSTGIFTPSYDGLVSINNTLKLYTGLRVDGVDTYNIRGTFMFGNPRMTKNNNGQKTIELECYDMFSMLDGTISGILDYQYIVPSGTPISEAITQTLVDAGITTPILIYPTTKTTPYTLSIQQGGTYADILYGLAGMMTWQVFFDKYNVFRFQPPTDEDTQAEVWEFSTIDSWETTYLSGVHNFGWNQIRNYISVVGDNINGAIVKAIAQNNNIFSDTYVGKIGKRTAVVEDTQISTLQEAQDRADYELEIQTNIQESVDMECTPVDIIDEDDIVLVNDPENALYRDRYLVNTINFPLKNGGTMQCNLIKAREVQPL
jgi:hypothetical protein